MRSLSRREKKSTCSLGEKYRTMEKSSSNEVKLYACERGGCLMSLRDTLGCNIYGITRDGCEGGCGPHS